MAKINTLNYQTVASWNGSQDLFVVEQPDSTKVATPAMVKQYIEAGDFEATGEVKDGHGNTLADMAKSADVNTALAGKQDTLTFDDAPTANSNNPVKSGGIKTYVDNAVSNKVDYYRSSSGNETQSINVGANTEQVNRIFLLSAGYTTRYVLGMVMLEYNGAISYVNISSSGIAVSSVSFSSDVVTIVFNTNPWTKARLTRLC